MTYLSKWPRLIVAGEAVTADQAAEIIVRTDSWHLIGNDQEWARQLAQELGGVAFDEHGWARWDDLAAARRHLAVLDLEYLGNARIYSSWIGGPHGWVTWDGFVGCSTWNIGKWPDLDEVTAEWEAIAKAWPFLRLSAQLLTDEGAGRLAVQHDIADGRVAVNETPMRQLTPVMEAPIDIGGLMMRAEYSHRERGCTIEQLRHAFELVRGRQA